MKKAVILGVMAFMAWTSADKMYAQNAGNNGDRAAHRAEMLEKRVERMAKMLELKDDAKEAFTKNYRAYLQEMETGMTAETTPGDRKAEAGGKKEKALTDAEATLEIQKQFDRQAQRIERMQRQLEVQKKYYAEFAKTLSPKQLMKIFRQQRPDGNRNAAGGRGNNAGRMHNGGPRGGGFGGPDGGFGNMD